MRLLAPVFANVLLLFAVLGFGSLVRSIYPKEHSRVDAAAMTLLGGLGVVGILLFCVGQFWFTRNSILFVLCVGMLLSVRPALGLLRNWRQWFANLEAPKLPVAIILVVFLVTAIGGMTVLVGDMNHDSIAYHYLGPTVWLKQGVIRAETLTYFPVIVESEYAALMALGGQRAPNLFAVVSLAALLLSAASLAVRMGADRRAVWWALALIASTPAIHIGVYGGFIDAIFAGFVLMAARIAFDANQPRQYAVCGIFCGLAMGTKYTGIMAVGLLALSMIVTAVWTNSHSAQVVKCLAVGGLVAVVVASPFYLRNWVLYGCPIYPPPPGLLRFFSPRGMLPGVMQELLKNVRDTGVGLGRRPMDFLLLPFNLTYHTSNFRGAGGIGLVPLALAPFGQAVLRRDAFAKGMALFAVLQTAGWFLTAQVSRYLIPVYVIALIFGVIGWGYIKQSGRRYSKILAALIIAISVAYGLFMIWSGRAADVRAGLSSKYEARRQHEGTPYFDSFEYINSEPSVKRVLILNPHVAAYFVEKDYVKPFGRWGEQTVPGASSVEQVMERLPSLQVTHILDVKHDGGPFSLLEKPPGLTLVLERADQRIYRVN
jgi:hypothetical protein